MFRLVPVALVVLLVLVQGCATQRRSGAEIDANGWLELHSPSFKIATNGDEAQLRRLGADLEKFVAVVQILMGLDGLGEGRPMGIYVFRNRSEYFGAGGDRVTSGFARTTFDASYLVLPFDRYATMTRVVLYHEFVHYLLRRHGRDYPLWYHEGLAEMLSTMQVRDGAVAIGFPPSYRRRDLESDELLPLADLLETRSIAVLPVAQRSLFYAQSWALVHYLHLTQRKQLVAYLGRVREGVAWREAFAESFDPSLEELEAELREYWVSIRSGVRFLNLREPEVDFEPHWRVRAIPSREMVELLAELQLVRGGEGATNAVRYLQRALEHDPNRADLHAALGWCRAIEEEDEAADASIAEAMRLDADDAEVWLYAGGVALVRAERGEGAPDAELLATARARFRRSTELAPEWALPFAELGNTYTLDEETSAEDVEAGLRALETARRIGGQNALVELGLGVLQLRAGRPELAVPHLHRAAHFSHHVETGEEAQQLLDELAPPQEVPEAPAAE